eukprot:TRINITY_DN52359_c0_g1_i1.p1 TRINITY_DN52359_c0_g1~~TRINITY_DN52359_c0_g1_i1.p1  ORF type:complete len:269 (+),score=47.89 TRINITY_DN52359_c0_g1_i1:67-807(+)
MRSVVVRLVLSVCLLVARNAAAQEGDGLPPWETIETHLGELKIREFGPRDGPLAILVHGMMNNDYIRNEWNPVALQLAEKDFHVIVPDFHSGSQKMRPGSMSGDDFRRLVSDYFAHRNEMVPSRYRASVSPKVLVMGKSWGAKMAAAAGSLDAVVATAFVVPAISGHAANDMFPKIKGEMVIALTKDDNNVPYERARKELGEASNGRKVQWIIAEKGGHRIVSDFVEPLVNFAELVREHFQHSGEL